MKDSDFSNATERDVEIARQKGWTWIFKHSIFGYLGIEPDDETSRLRARVGRDWVDYKPVPCFDENHQEVLT